MISSLWFLSVFVLHCIACGRPADPVFPSEMLFTLERDYRILVRGRMKDVDDLNLMIDTGSNCSLVDKSIVDKLRLPVLSEEPNTDANGRQRPVRRVLLSGLRIGPVMTSVLCYVTELPLRNVDVLIGTDFLSNHGLTINYRSRKIGFAPTDELEWSVQCESEYGLLLVPVLVEDQILRLIADTGVEATGIYSNRLANAASLALNRRQYIMDHVSGRCVGTLTSLPQVRIGQCGWRRLTAFLLSDDRPPQVINRAERFAWDGILGIASLGLKRVSFNFDKRILSWER